MGTSELVSRARGMKKGQAEHGDVIHGIMVFQTHTSVSLGLVPLNPRIPALQQREPGPAPRSKDWNPMELLQVPATATVLPKPQEFLLCFV